MEATASPAVDREGGGSIGDGEQPLRQPPPLAATHARHDDGDAGSPETVRDDVADTYSVDSASSIGAVSRASLFESAEPHWETASTTKLALGEEDGVSSDSGRLTAVAECRGDDGVEDDDATGVVDGAFERQTSSMSRSSPESDASSSKDEAFSKDESPNHPVVELPPRPRRRTVSFIGEKHLPPTSARAEESSATSGADEGDGCASTTTASTTTTTEAVSTTATVDAGAPATPWEAKMFRVAYLGNSVMDRRYPTDLQPWVMAELRRIGTTTPIVLSAISGGSVLHGLPTTAVRGAVEPILLRAVSEMDSSILFEHDMSCISRFVRLHTDKLCFAFMTKNPQNLETPYTCFVFLGYNEDVVPALFNLVRKCALLSSSSADMRLRSGSCSKESDIVSDGYVPSRPLSYDNFEVQYRGRLRVSGHKGPDSLIDDCLIKLESKLERRRSKLLQRQQQLSTEEKKDGAGSDLGRPNSGDSAKRRRSGVANESSAPSFDRVAVQPDNNNDVFPPDGASSDLPPTFTFKCRAMSDGGDDDVVGNSKSSTGDPRAVIFQVGVNDILIRDPTTGSVETKNYEQISKCQTGLQAVDHFGFIWRETSVTSSPSASIKREYFVYVFKGASEQVVNEIMLKLHQSFSALHAQRTQARAVTCELCPMHQLHKLCREIEGLEADKAIGILVQRIEAQDEEDVQYIVTRYKMESPKANDPQDHLEVLMSVLRQVCQQKQVHHVHIAERRESASSSSDVVSNAAAGKDVVHSSDFILDAPTRKVSTADKFSHFFKRTAKKSLLASFEQLVKGGEAGIEEESSLSGSNSSRRPSVQMLHSMTDSFSACSDAGGDDAASSSSSTQWGPFKGASPPLKRATAGEAPTREYTPFSAKPAISPKARPRSKTLGQLPNLPIRWKRDAATPGVDPTASSAAAEVEGQPENAEQEMSVGPTEAQLEFAISPKKKMFARIGQPGSGLGPEDSAEDGSRRSSMGAEAPETSVFLEESPPKMPRNKSWRQSLYRHVVTPGKGDDSDSDLSRRSSIVDPASAPSSRRPSANVDGLTWMTSPTAVVSPLAKSPSTKRRRSKRSSEELRDLWRSAITQQILLNKMERQNSQLAESQDKAVLKRERLLYEELTPCLKRVTADWDQALLLSTPASIPYDRLRDLVHRGVPRAKRGLIWKFLIQQEEASKPFQRLADAAPDASSVDADRSYGELLTHLTIHQHAILIDLARTFPSHPYFSKQLGPGQLSLFNLLKAYSIIDANVGYCQGLSFVAGILLMHLEEEESFEAMKYLLLKTGLRQQYCPEMTALQVQMYQLSRLIHDHHPKLSKKLDSFEMSPTLFAASWFLTLFASQFPLGFVARVFDMVFLEGIQAVFKVAVALLGQHLPLIVECDSFESLVEFLKNTLPGLTNVQMERVIAEAFELEEDIYKYLNAYQIEYHIFQDELAISPGGSTGHTTLSSKIPGIENVDETARNLELEKTNRKLKQQNFALLEQLQAAQATIDLYATTVRELKARVDVLEMAADGKSDAENNNDLNIILNNNGEYRASVG